MAQAIETFHGLQILITQVSKLVSIGSSDVLIHGIPWKVKVFKEKTNKGDDNKDEEDKAWLAVRLICGNNDESSGWSIAGAVSCKLLSFNDELDVYEHYAGPYVFDRSSKYAIAFNNIIEWNDLFDKANKYVKDDTIKLEIKIEAENPNDPNKSGVIFESIQKSCDCQSSATYRLTVKNVSKLIAVRTPPFILRGLSWKILVGKNRLSNLFALLDFDSQPKGISCPVVWSIKLLSSKVHIDPIELTRTDLLSSSEYLSTGNIASWSQIFKPENGYVNNGSIALEVEIVTNKLRSDGATDLPYAKRAKLIPERESQSPQMECPICLKCINSQELASTACGHLFCFACIKTALTNRAACPVCSKVARSNALRRIYLPGVN